MSRSSMVYIPTYHRMEYSRQHTLQALTKAGIPCALAVHLDQYRAYERNMPKGTDFLVMPDATVGIGNVRHYIATRVPADNIFMFDDDLRFFVRRNAYVEDVRLRNAEDQDLVDGMEHLNAALSKETTAQVGFSCREGNNHVQGPNARQWNARCMRAIGIRADVFRYNDFSYRRLQEKEDFDFTLQLLRAGFDNYITFEWSQNQRTSNDRGGCSTRRTHKTLEVSSERLKELHPAFVTVVEKKTKTAWGGKIGGVRKDVRIQWKRARASYEIDRQFGQPHHGHEQGE